MSQQLDEKDIWNIIESFFEQNGLVHQQLESFNDYINRGIQQVIDEEADIQIEPSKGQRYVVKFGEVYIAPPSVIEDDRTLKRIFPSDARNRDLNYDSAIFCNITETLYEDTKVIETTEHRRISIGRTPIMLRSDICNLNKLSAHERIKVGECEKDNGGYFIIRGNERVIVSQLRGNYNQVIVLKQKPGEKYSHVAEIRSMSEETGHSVQLKAMIGNDKRTIVFSLPYIKEVLPVGIVFKALGFTDEKDIVDLIGIDNSEAKKYIRLIIRDAFFIQSQEQALSYIGQFSLHIIPKEKRKTYALQVVETELLPHMGVTATVREKAVFLGHIVKKLFETQLGMRSPDDRDNYANKRIESCGTLCTDLFRTLFKRYLNTIKLQLEKKKSRLEVMTIISRLSSITQGLKHSFATGNWGPQKNAYIRTGVSQIMSRMTYGATLSHARRIVIPIGKEGKNAKIRQIHSSQFGYICPAETPEGQSSGIVLNYSLLARVTRKIPTSLIKEVLEENKNIIPIKDISMGSIVTSTHVFLNGILMGMTDDPDTLVEELIALRKYRRLDKDVSVTYDPIDEEVRIFSDAGRGSRPLFTVGDDGLNIDKKSGTSWNDLVRSGMIEYIDNSEIENYVIAMNFSKLNAWKNDYCEIHPSMMLGVMGSIIPFPDHNPSPRNCYQCLDPKELVVMSNNTQKKIKDIKIGDVVVTVNPKTYEQTHTPVTHHYVKKNKKQIISLTTESGRSITCTEDHRMLTPSGWVEAKDAKFVCIIPTQKFFHVTHQNVLYVLPEVKTKEKHMKELTKLSLFPVNYIHTPTLARMVGFMLSDGSAGIYNGYPQVQMTFGSKTGRKEFERDVRSLGFTCNKAVSVYSEKYGKCEQVIYNNSLASLLIGLVGGYVGKRSTQAHPPVVEWIFNGSKIVKREFLAGFQGGDGCKIRYNILTGRKSGNFVLNSTSQTSKNEYVDNLVSFMKQLKYMFEDFGVMCTGPTIRSNGTSDSKCVHLYFSNTRTNLITYFENIGWRYDHYKHTSSIPVYEYLKYCEYQIGKIRCERKTIDDLCEQKHTPSYIASILGKKPSYIRDSIKSIKEGRNPRMTNKSPVYQEWIKDRITKDNAIFVAVDTKTPQPDGLICDITIKSENHSFIAGNSFCVHNCSMGKQALGIYALSYKQRTDTIVYVLDYPQKPLVSTRPSKFMGFDDMPSGINAVVAIMSYSGYNQEDSVIMSKAAIERGLFSVTSYRTVSDTEKKGGMYTYETIGVPPPSRGKPGMPGYFRRKNGNYSLLDERGVVRVRSEYMRNGRIVREGIRVKKGDIIIGKVHTKSSKSGETTLTDCSVAIKHGEEGIIDRVHVSVTPNGYKMVKVVIRKQRIPEIGDKFASRAAQKGTMGIMYRQEDLPFNQDGIVPDIIINPHAIPSRMTVGQLMECVMGKACAIGGTYGDATPFTSSSTDGAAEKICEMLAQAGMKENMAHDRTGWETMYNGFTGLPVKAKVFMGPTYYQRLKHMVSDKIHARAHGHVTTMTRQPLEGRSRDGGLRFGEINFGLSHMATCWLVLIVITTTRQHIQIAGTTRQNMYRLLVPNLLRNQRWSQLTAESMVKI